MAPASKALMRMYNNLEIKCNNPKCGKVVKLCDIVKHEEDCNTPNCLNYNNCN